MIQSMIHSLCLLVGKKYCSGTEISHMQDKKYDFCTWINMKSILNHDMEIRLYHCGSFCQVCYCFVKITAHWGFLSPHFILLLNQAKCAHKISISSNLNQLSKSKQIKFFLMICFYWIRLSDPLSKILNCSYGNYNINATGLRRHHILYLFIFCFSPAKYQVLLPSFD